MQGTQTKELDGLYRGILQYFDDIGVLTSPLSMSLLLPNSKMITVLPVTAY